MQKYTTKKVGKEWQVVGPNGLLATCSEEEDATGIADALNHGGGIVVEREMAVTK